MKGFLRGVATAIALLSLTSIGFAANRTIIILDASGSMWAKIDGKPKLQIARESLRTALQSISADEEIGFMAYGHRTKGSCDDIELIVPPAAGTAAKISSAADNLKFLGKTPLTAAVKQAAEALKYTENKATVVLITDGLETCDGDPCTLGTELEATGVDFTADIVGFGLTADEGKQVACLAENTGGKYIQASDEKGLQDALTKTIAVAPAPQPAPAPPKPEFNFVPSVIMAEGGEPIKDGNAWEVYKANPNGSRGESLDTAYNEYKRDLDPGSYIVVARMDEARTEQMVKIEPGKIYSPVFILNAGTLHIHPRPAAGADINDSAHVDFAYPGGSGSHYGDTKIVLPAGEEKVTVSIGNGSITESIQLAAGQMLDKDIIVGVGHVVLNAFYTAGGGKADGSGIGFQIVKAKKKLDGSRDDVEYSYGPDSKFDLPPGDYIAIATVGATVIEQPFSVQVDESKDVSVVLNAGTLAVSASGAYRIEVAGSRDIQGNRKTLAGQYGETLQTTLPGGAYTVLTILPGDAGTKETPASVKPGERTELTVQRN